MLKIYNSLGRAKQEFVPLNPPEVRMYVCGMTVYDFMHLGHARMLVAFDVVARYLRALGYRLTYVRNITDIDDKIIKRANEKGEPIQALTERFIRANEEDYAALGLLRPEHEPRATQSIAGMIRMIGELIARGHAYAGANGDVYYDVSSFEGYGRLSGKEPQALRAGARVEVDEAKHDPLDFVLWKAAKPGEPAWDSPWGRGRPGWHIECSVMSTELLGSRFDIHGGGEDLQFPHHENEIAQSEGANGVKFVNYWMHNGFVRVDEEKMSKSLGNFFTVREVLKKYDAEVVRFFILRAHYRSPLNYSDAHLEDAKSALTRLYTALKGSSREFFSVDWNEPHAGRFKEAMDDDFATPEAVAVLFDLAHEVNSGNTIAATRLRALGGVLGILQRGAEEFLQGGGSGDDWITERITAREAARKRKDYAAADDIRRELAEKGIVLEDKGGRTTWRRK
ncbi:MAG TPA: cysteine--tRNA ligase [Burkholderiales bacterium]|nr:cysteine--tRNA ligase [Burkholderiales bacterium]